MKNIHIAVIGGPATGKSTYISALVQGLKDKLWNETDLAYLPAAPNLWSLYRKGELYFSEDPTGAMFFKDCHSRTVKMPLCIVEKQTPKIISLEFSDIIAEDLEDSSSFECLIEDLHWSEKNRPNAIILLVDPIPVLGHDVLKGEYGVCLCTAFETVKILNNFIYAVQKSYKNIKNIPIAVVVNKMDLLTRVFSDKDAKEFDGEKFLEHCGIQNIICQNFLKHELFYSSSVTIEGSNTIKYNPSIQLSPFIWILKNIENIK